MWRDLLIYFTGISLPCVVLIALIHIERLGMEACVMPPALAAFTMVAMVMRRAFGVLRFHSIWIGLLLLVLQLAVCAFGIVAATLVWAMKDGFEGVF
jgi:hypothetical protein